MVILDFMPIFESDNKKENREMQYSDIKLIIWDLDDTLWNGTLSEGDVFLPKEHADLIRRLVDCGIVSSICSKNDASAVLEKLNEFEIQDYFVFNSIDWTPKGERVSRMIADMGFRQENVLFVDDNVTNLNEVKYFAPQINFAEPEIIPSLINYFNEIEPTDLGHTRLSNYKILEKKQISKSHYSDNIQFLYSTNTHVVINRDCIAEIDRIAELVKRTNQLNYTKLRSSKEELLTLLSDETIDAGYVTVEDNFGKYGIVGFFAIKNNRCIHFLFSCRTIGQGVEQYVYSTLNFPEIQVAGDVIVDLKKEPAPLWINQNKTSSRQAAKGKLAGKVLFKGPCDLSSMVFNFDSSSILTEFTYIGDRQNSIEHHNHSVNYLRFPFLSNEEKETLLEECIFNDAQMFETDLFNPEVKLIFLSTLPEGSLAVYRRKRDGYLLAFGEYCNDLTDTNNIDDFLNGKLYCYSNNYTKEWLQAFSNTWEYQGRISVDEYIENIKTLLRKRPDTTLVLMLGSETPYLANTRKLFENRHLYHKELNDALRLFAKQNERVLLLDFNDFIKGQDDFTDTINHFQRRVYFEISQKANEYIEKILGEKVKPKSNLRKLTDYYVPRIKGWIYDRTPEFVKEIRKRYRKQ